MNISNRGKDFIREREALRLTAYADSGGYAIGYGNMYYEDGSRVAKGDTITKQRAEQLFNNIVAGFASGVNKLITSNVNQSQFDALVSYAYNRGVTRFKNTTLLVLVNQNPDDPRIYNQFLIEWGTNQTYKNGLLNRRKMEADLYFTPSINQPILAGFSIFNLAIFFGLLLGGSWLYYFLKIKGIINF